MLAPGQRGSVPVGVEEEAGGPAAGADPLRRILQRREARRLRYPPSPSTSWPYVIRCNAVKNDDGKTVFIRHVEFPPQ